MQGTRPIYKTSANVAAGSLLDLTPSYPRGVCVSAYPAVRMACGSSASSNVPVTIRLVVMSGEEQVSYLDQFTLLPGGKYSVAYDVPGVGLKAIAEAQAGAGSAHVDLLLFGYAPYLSTNSTCCCI